MSPGKGDGSNEEDFDELYKPRRTRGPPSDQKPNRSKTNRTPLTVVTPNNGDPCATELATKTSISPCFIFGTITYSEQMGLGGMNLELNLWQ